LLKRVIHTQIRKKKEKQAAVVAQNWKQTQGRIIKAGKHLCFAA
jgi:hypothetical protein